MSEESISASPEVRKNSHQNIELHKKKRRRLNHRKSNLIFNTSSIDKTNCNEKPNISAMYYNEMPDDAVKVFNNPLKDESLLALADKTLPETRRKFDSKYAKKCFQKVDSIDAAEVEETNLDITMNASISGPETQFEITETELLQVCEKIEEDNTLIKSPTGACKNSIVQSILEDLDSIGCSPSPSKISDNLDDTPRFQFKIKTLRTYSRNRNNSNSNNPQNNIVRNLENTYESDSALSDDSDVAFQSQIRPPSEQINLNTSFSIWNNVRSLNKLFEIDTDFEKTFVEYQNDESTYSQRLSQNTTFIEATQMVETNYLFPSIKTENDSWAFVLERDTSDEEFHGFEDYEINVFKNSRIIHRVENKELLEPSKPTQNAKEIDSHLTLKKNATQSRIPTSAIPHSVQIPAFLSPSSNFNTSNLQNLLDDCHSWDDTDFDNVLPAAESLASFNPAVDIEDVSWSEDFPTVNKDGESNEININKSVLVSKANVSFKTAFSKTTTTRVKLEKPDPELETEMSNFGFKTGKSKPISISEKSKQKAAAFLRKFEEDEQKINNIVEAEEKLPSVNNLKFAPIQTNKEPELKEAVFANNGQTDTMSISFTTASKKAISVSKEALEKANKLIKEADGDPLPGSLDEAANSFTRHRNYFEMLNEQSQNSLEKNSKFHVTSKTKSIPCTSTSRTPLNPIDNRSTPNNKNLRPKLVTTPLSHQSSTDNRSIAFSKRNLLTLSKRNFRAPSSIEAKLKMTSPNKAIDNSPKIEEFFRSVSTSTPCNNTLPSSTIHRDVTRKSVIPLTGNVFEDNDFKKIQWNDSTLNKSNHPESNVNFSSNNVSITELSPSPQMRYERLKMFGRPSALSPILMANQCRASGLKRSRDSGKKA